MKQRHFMRCAAAAAFACLLLTVPLAAQAAEPALPASGTAVFSEESNSDGMKLNRSDVTLTITSSVPNPSVTLRVESTKAAYRYVTWSSSNVAAASVDSYGTVTAHKAGVTLISCRTDTGEYADCWVTVQEAAPALNEESIVLTMHYNDTNPTKQLYLKEGKGALSNWYSTDPTVASVSAEGLVTAQSVGKATIGVTTAEGRRLTCTVEVKSDIGQVLLSKEQLLLHNVGGTQGLTAVMDGNTVPVTWASSDPGVASVDANGVVTAVAAGQAVITATAENGTTAECKVYVGSEADRKQTADNLMLALAVGGIVAVIGVAAVAGD